MLNGRILVVDSSRETCELINSIMESNGYKVICAGSGETAVEMVRSFSIDLILLELMLPGIDGFDVCRILKNDYRTSHVPIIIVTANENETDIVTGLELGADYCITRPINQRILIARIKALMKRHHELDVCNIYTHNNISLNVITREVLVNQTNVDLTPTEFNILLLLMKRPGWIFTRKHIIDTLKGNSRTVTDRLIDVHIVGLRKKLGADGHFIQTIRGEGYQLKGN